MNATELAPLPSNRTAFVLTSYTTTAEFSSTTASFFLNADMSRHRTDAPWLTSSTGKSLSMKIFRHMPSLRPTSTPSPFSGPPFTLMYLITESIDQVRSFLPSIVYSSSFFSMHRMTWCEVMTSRLHLRFSSIVVIILYCMSSGSSLSIF